MIYDSFQNEADEKKYLPSGIDLFQVQSHFIFDQNSVPPRARILKPSPNSPLFYTIAKYLKKNSNPVGFQTFSNKTAVPCPPPMQAEAMPYLTPLFFISLERVKDNLVPVAAKG